MAKRHLAMITDPADPRLYAPNRPVKDVHAPAMVALATSLVEIASKTPRCIGLAANQVGANVQMAAIYSAEKKAWLVICNPKITAWSPQVVYGPEGCLSHPGIEVDVGRHIWIEMVCKDMSSNKEQQVRIYDRQDTQYPSLTRIFQHECLWGESEIQTEDGIQRIMDMVADKYSGKVLSCNPNTMQPEWKSVVGWSKKPNRGSKQWVMLKSKSGKENRAIITSDHPVAYIDNILAPNAILYAPAKDMLGKFQVMLPRSDREKNKTHGLFSKDQMSILLGTILGDGHISKKNEVSFVHSEKQKDYGDYKSHALGGFTPQETRAGYTSSLKIRYSGNVGPQTEKLREMLYPGGIKTIRNVLSLIDDKALAFWYMDDGCLHSSSSATLHTESFSKEDNLEIITMLSSKYRIKASLRQRGKRNLYYLAFGKVDTARLHNLIGRYIHPSMAYKLVGQYEFEPLGGSRLPITARYIREVAPSDRQSSLYDITVEDNHNVFVNYNLVHNCDHLRGVSIVDPTVPHRNITLIPSGQEALLQAEAERLAKGDEYMEPEV